MSDFEWQREIRENLVPGLYNLLAPSGRNSAAVVTADGRVLVHTWDAGDLRDRTEFYPGGEWEFTLLAPGDLEVPGE